MMMLNLVLVSVPGSTMLMRSQLMGNSVVWFKLLEPSIYVYSALMLLPQG